MILRILLAAALATAVLVPATATDAAANDCSSSDGKVGGNADDDVFTIHGQNRTCEETPGSDGGPPVFTERVEVPIPLCGQPDVLGVFDRPCIDEEDAFICFDGSMARNSVFIRTHVNGVAGEWRMAYGGGCPEFGDVDERVSEYFTTSALPPSPAGRQPDGPSGLVNMPLVLFADPTPQVITTVLGPWTVTITATPNSYTWDLGPAGEIATTDPGAPYPDHTVAPEIRVLGDLPVTLTTTWLGTFQVNGRGPQYPINGVATTVTTLDPITITEARTYLVTENY